MNFRAVKITERVWWVGAVDWELRNFHGYTTKRGSTYNAYLVVDEKVALIDTVKAKFKDQLLARISDVVDPKRIDYIISNHAEMDHSGLLPFMIDYVKPEKIFASPMGVKALKEQLHLKAEISAVSDGDELSLGKTKLKFIETRMLHWPDSMFSYLEGEGVLFSQDAFGMHLAVSSIFADENDICEMEQEAAAYFANILMPFSGLVLNLFKKLETLGLGIKVIAPDHGPVYRREKEISWILERYKQWAEKRHNKRCVVVYDTMWGSTEKMAHSIADGISLEGLEVKVMPLSASDRSDVATEFLLSTGIAVGAPTLNNNLFPSVADVLTYLKGLRPKNLVGVAFGSYGWSGESVSQIKNFFEAMKVNIIGEAKSKFVPDKEKLSECFELGRRLALEVKKLCGA